MLHILRCNGWMESGSRWYVRWTRLVAEWLTTIHSTHTYIRLYKGFLGICLTQLQSEGVTQKLMHGLCNVCRWLQAMEALIAKRNAKKRRKAKKWCGGLPKSRAIGGPIAPKNPTFLYSTLQLGVDYIGPQRDGRQHLLMSFVLSRL